MHLWTEYEGRTVDEHYTLGKLLRSEGRNGFFATADKDGHPAVIRLTEAHYDEAELLHRWRQVAEVHQDNLIEIEQVGQTSIEGVALTYALMEPDDANLGDVLRERPMTTAETTQVAKAVLSALHALHTSGLVHEHVEAANVLAVGETVKLRSDCVRECVADGEFTTEEACTDLRRKDIHDFGALLLRCLTLETEWSPAHNNLPDPFKRIIPKALDGSWTLEQIGSALDPTLFAPKPATPPTYTPQNSSSTSATATSQPSAGQFIPAANSTGTADTLAGASATSPNPAKPLVPPGVRQTSPQTNDTLLHTRREADSTETSFADPSVPARPRFRAEPAEPTHEPSKALWAILAAAAVLVLLLGWHFLGGSKPTPAPTSSSAAPIVNSGAVSQQQPAAPVQPTAPAVVPTQQSATPDTTSEPHTAAGGSGWYVIAYTYNREGQAATKAQRLRRTHDSLHPQVFTPTGHGPYFVSLGGAMSSQGEAEAVWRHARRAGLPRDTFVRHY